MWQTRLKRPRRTSFSGLIQGKRRAAVLHHQLDEGVARAGGGRRTEHLDLDVRQRRVLTSFQVLFGLAMSACRVGRVWHLLRAAPGRYRLRVSFKAAPVFELREHDAVVADLDLADVRHAVLGAGVDLALLDPARGVGDVGVLHADAIAEELDAAARAGALDLGRLELAGACRTARRLRW